MFNVPFDGTRLSDEETRILKEQKPVRWSKEAWEAAWMAREQPSTSLNWPNLPDCISCLATRLALSGLETSVSNREPLLQVSRSPSSQNRRKCSAVSTPLPQRQSAESTLGTLALNRHCLSPILPVLRSGPSSLPS
jgi:hypothetical protein